MLNSRYIWIGAWILMAPLTVFGDESELLSNSRALVVDYATQLQAELQAAMEFGGPVAAISVCKDVAPGIASALSRQSGAKVGRTSLRFRNAANAPESWEAEALATFRAGDAEFTQTTEDGTFRYMKAIPTGALCLACHGETLAPEIADSLEAEYPHDRARGYRLGDIRGAFSVSWPASGKPAEHTAGQ